MRGNLLRMSVCSTKCSWGPTPFPGSIPSKRLTDAPEAKWEARFSTTSPQEENHCHAWSIHKIPMHTPRISCRAALTRWGTVEKLYASIRERITWGAGTFVPGCHYFAVNRAVGHYKFWNFTRHTPVLNATGQVIPRGSSTRAGSRVVRSQCV